MSTTTNVEQKGLVRTALTVGAATGSAGILYGSITAVVKSNPRVGIYAIGSGLSCFFLGTTYSGIRQTLFTTLIEGPNVVVTPREKTQISALAGGLTGGIGGLVLRGPKNVIPGTIMFTIFGLTGQAIYNKIDARHTTSTLQEQKLTAAEREEMKTQGFMDRILRSESSPVKKLTDDEYKGLLRKQILVIDADIAIVDDEIAYLRGRGGDGKKSS